MAVEKYFNGTDWVRIKRNASYNAIGNAVVTALANSGNAYIDTGIAASENLKIEIQFAATAYQFPNSGAYFPVVFGATKDGENESYAFYFHCFNADQCRFDFDANNLLSSFSGQLNTVYRVIKDGVNNYIYDENGTLLVSSTNSAPTFTENHNIYLFHRNLNNMFTTNRFTGKIYWCKMWESGVLVRDFVPRIYNGVPCFYDRATNSYYFNLGDDSFGVYVD